MAYSFRSMKPWQSGGVGTMALEWKTRMTKVAYWTVVDLLRPIIYWPGAGGVIYR